MTNILRTALMFATANLVLISCSNDNLGEQYNPDTTVKCVTLNGTTDWSGTRVELVDGKSLYWSADDELAIIEFADGKQTAETPKAIIEESGAKASFSAELTVVQGNSYKYYAVYPYRAYTDADDSCLNIDIPKNQTPSNEFADPQAAVLIGESAAQSMQGGKVGFLFNHAAAYLRLTVEGIPSGEPVESITISSGDTAVSGAYCWGLDDKENKAGESAIFNTIEINSENLTADENGNYTVWAAVFPDAELNELHVTVESENYTLTGTCSDTISVAAGHVASRTVAVSVGTNIPKNMELAFPDPTFRAYVLENFDIDKDGKISQYEASMVESVSINNYNSAEDAKISSLEGIQYFTNLQYLSCQGNKLTSLDVSKNTTLLSLSCYNNPLTSLDVSHNTALVGLYCHSTLLTELDLSKNPELEVLWCSSNRLTRLDVSHNPALISIGCFNCMLTELDLSNNIELTSLECYNNQLTKLEVSNNTALEWLQCYNNQLTSLNVSNNMALANFDCGSNQLTSLDVTNNKALTFLSCYYNQLTSLDLSNNTALEYLMCSHNQLTTLDVSKTNLGNSTYSRPLSCSMETLETLYLKSDWELYGITYNRDTFYISEQTKIAFVD